MDNDMIRKIRPEWTPSQLQRELRFTRSALNADPDAQDLLYRTDPWVASISEDQTRLDEVLDLDAGARADRKVAHSHLRAEVRAFAADLLVAVRNNRDDTRFLGFFPEPPSDTEAQAMPELLAQVQRWLEGYSDGVLEAHREPLAAWAARLDAALVEVDTLRLARLKRDDAHRSLCTELTSERDQLFQALQDRARDRGLSRSWPGLFFMSGQ